MKLQEASVSGFSLLHNSDSQHQHNQCQCWSIATRDIFELILNIHTHHLAETIPWNSYKFLIHIDLIQSTINSIE